MATRLDILAAAARRIVGEKAEQATMVDDLADAMADLVSGPLALQDAKRGPPSDSLTYARHLLWRDADHGTVLVAMVWPPNSRSAIHDHGSWGIVAVSEGRLRVTSYLRVDDAATEFQATLKPAGRLEVSPGSTLWTIPPRDEIHKIECSGCDTAISIHLYERDLERCRIFDIDNGTWDWASLSYTTS